MGRAAVWRGALAECYYQKAIHRLRPFSDNDSPRFLFYVLQTAAKLGVFVAEGNQNTVDHLTAEKLRKHRFPFPSPGEQRSIIRFLDRETAKIDALIAKKQRLIELLQEKRTALIGHAVTKGLHPGVPMKESGPNGLGCIPTHWDSKPLKYLTPDNRPIMYGIILPGPNVENGVPIVKGGDVAPGRLSLDRLSRTTHEIESNYVKSRLRGGDIVYAIRGSIGMAEIVPPELENVNLTQDAARVSPKVGLNNRWLLYALKSRPVFSQLDAKATGATIRGINIRDLKRAKVPVPPRSEQESISVFLDQETTKFDDLIDRVQLGIEQLREYRTALISAAVTGKIDIRGEVE